MEALNGAKSFLVAVGAYLILVIGSPVFAKDEICKQRVQFKKGSSEAILSNRLKGCEVVDYLLGAKAGQTMRVHLKTSNGANYFNVLTPGSDAAIAVGANLGNQWTGTPPVDGDFTVRVYLMRSAACRNEIANFTLKVGISGRANAKLVGTPYHATGAVPCSVGTDPKGSVQCSFGVIRYGCRHTRGC